MMSDNDYSVRDVVANPKVAIDVVAPTVLFVVAAATVDLPWAATLALGWCAVVFGYRLLRRQGVRYALSGLAGVGIGVAVALFSGRAEGFFVPGIVGNLIFALASAVSVLARRPLVAYTSAAIYRWPMQWYLHPRVRPAYSEITWLWAAYYLLKGGIQLALVQRGNLAALTTARVVLGWPGLAGLLFATYAYVRWRLERLDGPDVDTFRDAEPGR